MKTFSDRSGKTWTIVVDTDALKRVRSLAEVDLMQIVDGKELLRKLVADPCLLVDVLYAIVKPEADAQGVTDKVFGAAMVGQAISDATDAVIEDFAEFLPPHRGRPLKKAYGSILAMMNKGWAEIEKKIDAFDPDAELAKALKHSGEPSTSEPGSSG